MIVFKSKNGGGGFGDRIIGLVSCIFLSELLGEELLIDWSDPDINEYFSYKAIDRYELDNIRLIDCYDKLSYMREISDLGSYFSGHSIETNINFMRELSVNKDIDIAAYEKMVLDIYQKLFNEYLVPKQCLLEKVENNCSQFSGKTIGIQLRMGDVYMGVGKYKGLEMSSVPEIFSLIKSHHEFDSLFITSDNQDVIDMAYDFFLDKKIIYDDVEIKHTDRMKTSFGEMLKVLSDILTLSRTEYRFISLGSNFGRVANLASQSPGSFNIISDVGLSKLSLRDLLSIKKDRSLS